MKKAFFAATALVASAGTLSAQNVTSSNADITLGGYARFGVLHDGNGAEDGSGTTDITSRWRLQIDASTQTDAGATLGARVRFQVDGNDGTDDINQAEELNAARFFARMGGLEIGIGNIEGALESMPGQYTIDLGLTGHEEDYTVYNGRGDAYSSGGAGASTSNGVEVIYGIGDFGAHLSASDTNDRIALMGFYEFGNFVFAAGIQDSDDDFDTEWTIAVEGTVGLFDFGVAYASNGDEGFGTDVNGNGVIDGAENLGGDHWSIMARFDVGAGTNVEAYVADADYFESVGYGIDFNHDLGGGASLRGGVSDGGSNDDIIADFGVRFNF